MHVDDEHKTLFQLKKSLALSDNHLQSLKAIDGLSYRMGYEPLTEALVERHWQTV